MQVATKKTDEEMDDCWLRVERIDTITELRSPTCRHRLNLCECECTRAAVEDISKIPPEWVEEFAKAALPDSPIKFEVDPLPGECARRRRQRRRQLTDQARELCICITQSSGSTKKELMKRLLDEYIGKYRIMLTVS